MLQPKTIVKLSITGVLLLIGSIFLAVAMHTIDSTERGVVFHSDGSLSTMEPGKFQFVMPVWNEVTTYDVRDQVFTESAIGISLDLQETTTEVTVLYRPDPSRIADIHRNLGRSYEDKIVVPAVQGCVKDAVSYYNVEQLTGAIRARVADDIRNCITDELANNFLIPKTITVTDFDFSDQFNQAIEKKAIAQQAAQEEKNRLEQRGYEANGTIVLARAQAEAARLLAQSTSGQQGEAYLFLEWLKVWNGILPQYMGGEQGAGLLITPPNNSP